MFERYAVDWGFDEPERASVEMLNDLDVLKPSCHRIDELLERGNLSDDGGFVGCGDVEQRSRGR